MGDGVKCQHHTLTRPFCALAQQRQTVALKTPNPVRVRVGQGSARSRVGRSGPHPHTLHTGSGARRAALR